MRRTEYLDKSQAAEYLGNVPTRMIERLVSERRITFIKVGRYVRFHRADLDAYLEANTTRAAR